MQMCPSWPKEHDWKSCKRRTPFQGFKSLHLRQKKQKVLLHLLFFYTNRDLNPRGFLRNENSPVGCFQQKAARRVLKCRAFRSPSYKYARRSRSIRQIPSSAPKKQKVLLHLLFFYTNRDLNPRGFLRNENSPVGCFQQKAARRVLKCRAFRSPSYKYARRSRSIRQIPSSAPKQKSVLAIERIFAFYYSFFIIQYLVIH